MAEELADTHAAEQPDIGGVSGAEIPEKASEKPVTVREALTASIKEVSEKEERARDLASGKFVPKDKAPEKVEAKEIQPVKAEDVPKVTEIKSGPPPGWSQASKEFFNSLPPDHPIRQDVAKREGEVAQGFNDYREKTKQYDALERVLAPSRARFQQFGLKSDAEAIERLVGWEQAISANPSAAIMQLAQQYRVDLSQIAQPQDFQIDPGLQQTLRPVLDRFGQIEQKFDSFLSAQEQAEREKIASDITSFASDPKHPHFEKVRTAMGQLMQGGVVGPKDLEGAYQKAVWADSDLRDQLLREEDDKRKAEFAKTQAEQAKNARLAAISPGVRAPSSAPKADDKSSKGVRADLLRSISELRDRA